LTTEEEFQAIGGELFADGLFDLPDNFLGLGHFFSLFLRAKAPIMELKSAISSSFLPLETA
jgi:hypothetical protein